MAGPARVERLGRLLLFKEGGSERVQRVHEGRGLSEGHELSVGSSRGLLAVAVDGSSDDAGGRLRSHLDDDLGDDRDVTGARREASPSQGLV